MSRSGLFRATALLAASAAPLLAGSASAAELPQPRLVLVGKPLRPAPAEVAANPRARSAVMRVAERDGLAS